MVKYFDAYKEARKFMEKIGQERIANYGKKTVMGELKCYVEYDSIGKIIDNTTTSGL